MSSTLRVLRSSRLLRISSKSRVLWFLRDVKMSSKPSIFSTLRAFMEPMGKPLLEAVPPVEMEAFNELKALVKGKAPVGKGTPLGKNMLVEEEFDSVDMEVSLEEPESVDMAVSVEEELSPGLPDEPSKLNDWSGWASRIS